MPNDLRVRVASLVSTVAPPGVADAQMQNTIADYCAAMGIDTTGSNQAVLDRFTQRLWDEVRREAVAHRKRMKMLAKQAEIDAETNAELGT